ncbi:MAG: agmatinase [Candidatus Epulonipiscioides saccharophilum]|nr:MAG: agmatinase [Epulopiscium sp. AS2M-Bin001]
MIEGSKFIACENDKESADIIIFGVPFDGTTSFRPGTRFGPMAIRTDSYGIETYSAYQDLDLTEKKVADIGDLELPFGNTRRVLKKINEVSKSVLKLDKKPLMLGGEHLVTLGLVEELVKIYPDLCIIHFDAHTDLREDYLGEKLSHASVIKRIWDIVGDNKIYQFGIRSGTKEEFEFAKIHTVLNKFNANNIKEIASQLKGKQIYLTIDLDVLDPSIFSGTGTPEPGGMSFNEFLESLLCLKGLDFVGADIVELSPHYDQSSVSTAVACKIVREVLLML